MKKLPATIFSIFYKVAIIFLLSDDPKVLKFSTFPHLNLAKWNQVELAFTYLLLVLTRIVLLI